MSARQCDEIRLLLSEHLDGDLPPEAEARVREHLPACPACRARLELLRRTAAALRAQPDLPAPPAILAGVRARLHHVPWHRRFLEGRPWVLGVPVGALATVLVVVGVALFQARFPELRDTAVQAPHQQSIPTAETPPAPLPEPSRTVTPAPAPVPAPPPRPQPPRPP